MLTFAGARERFVLPAELVNSLREFTQRSGSTLFTVLLAAFKIVLTRYTGAADVSVGTPHTGRDHPDLQKLIGLFANTLVLRTSFAGDPSVKELLDRVRESTLAGFAHAGVPFDQVVNAIQPERDLNHSPLVQVMFSLNSSRLTSVPMGDVKISVEPMDQGTARLDLTLEAYEHDSDLVLEFEYNTDLFDASTIHRLQAHYTRTLQSIVVYPDQRISEIPILTDEEHEALLAGAMPDCCTYPKACVQELIAEQALKTPERVAVACDGDETTYRELMEKSGILAQRLRDLGVQPGVLVAVGLERSVWMPVALLGVLRAGGAYVPLDPQYPSDRIAYMLEDSGAAVLVTETSLRGVIPTGGAAVVCLDQLERGDVFEPVAVQHSDAAYVIYTSGSTGKPKGVQIPHGALVNFLHSMRKEPGITKDDRLLAVTTLSFDIAGLEMYLPLLSGARLEIAPRRTTTDPVPTGCNPRSCEITIMQATPATWRMLLDSGWKGKLGLKGCAEARRCHEIWPTGCSLRLRSVEPVRSDGNNNLVYSVSRRSAGRGQCTDRKAHRQHVSVYPRRTSAAECPRECAASSISAVLALRTDI